MKRVLAWARWEFDRPIEVTPVIRFITAERFLKAAILIVGGVALLVVTSRGDGIHGLGEDIQTQFNLAPGRGFFQDVVLKIVTKFGDYSRARDDALGGGAILYGALEAWEGVGLVRRRRWAEYLVLVATAVFLPLEIDELFHHATPLKGAALAINVLIIVYLIWRKRLFLERPGRDSPADPGTPEPA